MMDKSVRNVRWLGPAGGTGLVCWRTLDVLRWRLMEEFVFRNQNSDKFDEIDNQKQLVAKSRKLMEVKIRKLIRVSWENLRFAFNNKPQRNSSTISLQLKILQNILHPATRLQLFLPHIPRIPNFSSSPVTPSTDPPLLAQQTFIFKINFFCSFFLELSKQFFSI